MTDKKIQNIQQENQPKEDSQKEIEDVSPFLSEWRKKHQAYLDETEQAKKFETVEELERREDKPKKKALFSKKTKTPKNEKEKTTAEKIPAKAIWKSIPIFIGAFSLLVVSIYFLTPYSKEKQLTVLGNSQVSTDQILLSSQISRQDYTLTTIVNQAGYARNIKQSSPWIKSASMVYQFPDKFTITVEEYTRVGYVEQGGSYYPILSSGEVLTTPTPEAELAEKPTIIHITDKDLLKKLVLQLSSVNQELVSNIEDITLTPTKATKDFLTMKLYDGNTILVPLSDIEKKLPYYEKILPQLTGTSTVDMEVGIFSYTS